MTSDSITGLGIGVEVNYDAFNALNLLLGSGNDALTGFVTNTRFDGLVEGTETVNFNLVPTPSVQATKTGFWYWRENSLSAKSS